MDKAKDSGTWLKFFKDAGIPTKTGASYAHIFVENRINKDMLSDLTVDHLRLMGITLIGDIIAILRHAKSVHQDSLRKVVILKSKDDPPSSSSSSSSSSQSSSSSSSSSDSDQDVEMVEVTKVHSKKVMSQVAPESKRLGSKVKKEIVRPELEELKKQIRSKVIDNTSAQSNKSNSGSERKILNQPVKRKHYDEDDSAADEEDVPFKKSVSKTTNISKNSGTSILHRVQEDRVLQGPVKRNTIENHFIGPKLPPPKKTVFDRLGAETSSPQVSSTTEVAKSEIETKFTRTIGNVNVSMEPVKIVANIDIPPPKSSSVFNRLGDVTPEPPSSLKYAGVLKSPTSNKRPALTATKKIITMRADEPEVPVKLRAAVKPLLKKNMKLRVGGSPFEAKITPKLTRTGHTNGRFENPASEGIFANPKNALQLSAKERLGLQRQQNALNKNAKARLGLQVNAGRATKTLAMNQRLKRPIQMKNQFREEDTRTFSYQSEIAGSKKVSFGGIDRRLIPAVRSSQGIHSRLGPRRFS